MLRSVESAESVEAVELTDDARLRLLTVDLNNLASLDALPGLDALAGFDALAGLDSSLREVSVIVAFAVSCGTQASGGMIEAVFCPGKAGSLSAEPR